MMGDSVDLPQIMLKGKKFVNLPSAATASFVHQLLTICLDLQITRVFPLRRAEIFLLAEARQLFDEYGIVVMVPPAGSVTTFGFARAGEIVVVEEAGSGPVLNRGVFVQATANELRIFCAD